MKKTLCLLLMLVMLLSVSAFAVEYSAPGEYPIVENYGDVTLSFLVIDHPAILDWETNKFIQWMNEQTNVEIEFEMISSQDKADKLNLMLATGEFPDCIVGAEMKDATVVRYGMEEGLLMPLDDLIAENCPNLMKMWEEYPASKTIATMTDGHIYALPEINDCFHTYMHNKMWINQKWLDNLGLAMPTTIDEFYNVLKAFKEQDANGNGDPNDEIPMAGNVNGWGSHAEWFLMNSFCYYNVETLNNQTGDWGMWLQDGTVTDSFADPAFKEGLKFIKKLYDEGLLYEGSYNITNDQMTQLAENPDANLLGCAPGGYVHFCTLGGERYGEYAALLPLTGPDGYVNVVENSYVPFHCGYFAINADCEYPEIALKWADLCYTQLATLNSYYGPQGEAWEYNDDDTILGLDGNKAMYVQLIPWQETEPQELHCVQQIPDYRDRAIRVGLADDTTKDIMSADRLETLLQQVTMKYEPFARPECYLPPLKFSVEEADNMMVAKTECDRILKEYVIGFITGTKDIDGDYETFISELESAGYRDLQANYQAAYDAQWK